MRLHGLGALTNRELKKWYKDPMLFFITIIQPILWLLLFGKAMNLGAIFTSNPNIPPQLVEQAMKQTLGTSDYFSFMGVGMLGFLAFFTATFGGMSLVWDRRLGFLNKILSTPVSRGVIIVSKLLSSSLRAMAQAVIVLGVGWALGIKFGPTFSILSLLGVFLVVFLLCMGFSSLFALVAIRSTHWERPMAIVNLVNMPLMFASNAFYPTSLMPSWLAAVAKVNPLTYAIDALRQLLVYETDVGKLIFDLAYLAVFSAVLVAIGIILSKKYLSK
jgi:ABC-2 type transport system permease protein